MIHKRLIWNNREYFKAKHDTRIIPDFVFGTTTVLFTIASLRMGYIAYKKAIIHAKDFDDHVDRIINVMENNNNNNNIINIQINDNNPIEIKCNDQTKNDQFKRDLIKLLDNNNNNKSTNYTIMSDE